MSIRVLLADDHRMFREALRLPLQAAAGIEVVGEASDGAAALAAVAALRPDVLVLDIALPDINGIEIARSVSRDHPATRVVALSGYSDRLFVDEMLRAGARGYVLKSSGADELIDAIRAAVAGHAFLSPELTGRLVRQSPATAADGPPPSSVLGRREREVLRLLAGGKRSTEIAAELDIAAATVEVHRRNIRRKLGLNTTAELTRYAVREGLCAA